MAELWPTSCRRMFAADGHLAEARRAYLMRDAVVLGRDGIWRPLDIRRVKYCYYQR